MVVHTLAIGGFDHAGAIGHCKAGIGTLFMAPCFGDESAGVAPGIALVFKGIESTLSFTGLFIFHHRLLQELFGLFLEPGIGGKAEGKGQIISVTDRTHLRHGESGVRTQMDLNIRAFLTLGIVTK
jgi:hypothetical protein